MAKTLSEAARAARAAAADHRAIAVLYDRRAAQQELADNLATYGTQLEDVRESIKRIDGQIAALQKQMSDREEVPRVRSEQ